METPFVNRNLVATLSNGKRVANFSSPHPFTFTDGTILPARSNEDAERLKVNFIEDVDSDGDVRLSFELSKEVWQEIHHWMMMFAHDKVDVVFCPLPMLTAIKQNNPDFNLKSTPFRAIRMEDRIKKLVSIEKQCL
jgi:hypothetical protein